MTIRSVDEARETIKVLVEKHPFLTDPRKTTLGMSTLDMLNYAEAFGYMACLEHDPIVKGLVKAANFGQHLNEQAVHVDSMLRQGRVKPHKLDPSNINSCIYCLEYFKAKEAIEQYHASMKDGA